MPTLDAIRTAIDAATEPEQPALERARMIIVDKLGERDSLGLDELIESVCEAYDAHSGEPLRLVDVDPSAPETDTPALRNLRYARAARTAIIALLDEGTIVAVEPLPGDGEMVRATGEGDPAGDQDDDEVTAAKETTDAAAAKAGAEEVVVATGPQPEGRRFSLADR
ncbi:MULTISPECIES: hypothetical protein [Dietzia]|uniref:Uncharacterized protein n=1 Tax=Dietzia cinnamea TaxID=321318 RepID=A0AAW5Q5H8_9ACTN|nr:MULTISPECIES: hypothetical protein [Dietzia]KZO58040.1 hypothetical protein A2U19_15120 [Dietzia maris]MBM7231546.1 hypothetical protein [Dietzia cinnamea]MCT1864813.1 hypothetical protein [Dietzia cinnamea]MCT2030003.1 hypothetical protein [Dietzia cinnamea]MCT2034284.1 hypothetical protein [Dietzia cinnamea]